jgi:hypothetical protein
LVIEILNYRHRAAPFDPGNLGAKHLGAVASNHGYVAHAAFSQNANMPGE